MRASRLIFQCSQIGNGVEGHGGLAYSIKLIPFTGPSEEEKDTKYCLFRFIKREPSEDLYALSLAPQKRNR